MAGLLGRAGTGYTGPLRASQSENQTHCSATNHRSNFRASSSLWAPAQRHKRGFSCEAHGHDVAGKAANAGLRARPESKTRCFVGTLTSSPLVHSPPLPTHRPAPRQPQTKTLVTTTCQLDASACICPQAPTPHCRSPTVHPLTRYFIRLAEMGPWRRLVAVLHGICHQLETKSGIGLVSVPRFVAAKGPLIGLPWGDHCGVSLQPSWKGERGRNAGSPWLAP